MDILIIIGSYLLAWAIKFEEALFKQDFSRVDIKIYVITLVVIVPAFIILYALFGLYAPKRTHGPMYELWSIVRGDALGIGILVLVLYLAKIVDYSRTMLFIFAAIDIGLEIIARVFLRKVLRSLRKKGFNQKHILLVGYSRAAESYIDRIISNPQWGYHVLGILDDNVPENTKYRGERIIGKVSELEKTIRGNDLDEVVITLGLAEYDKLESVANICEKQGVHTKFIPDYNNIIPTKPFIEDVQGLPVVNIRNVPLTNSGNRFVKRAMDLVIGSIALVIFSPVMLITAILVKCSSPGKIIYKQERVGLHSKTFNMYKFRSMADKKDGSDITGWTVKEDPRVTKVGKFIRKTSIDELPQLINVIKGDMSLVGPRPERPIYVERFKEEIPRYMVKHQVRPGMTGWAQINGLRGDTSISKRIEFDIYYIENWSFGFDMEILFGTVFKGFVNKNAY